MQYLQERQVELESKLVELTEQNAQLSSQVTLMCQNPASAPSVDPNEVTGEIAYLRQECERLREIARESNQSVKRDQTDPVHRKCVECVYKERELVELKRIVFRLVYSGYGYKNIFFNTRQYSYNRFLCIFVVLLELLIVVTKSLTI